MSKRARIENLLEREQLLGFARRQAKSFVRRTVKKSEIDRMEESGWTVQRRNKASVSVIRAKSQFDQFESRLWSLLYRMGFTHLSGEGGCELILNVRDPGSPAARLGIAAVDDEVAIALECRSHEAGKQDRLANRLSELGGIRRHFAGAISEALPEQQERHAATVMVTWDLEVRDPDRARAAAAGVLMLDEVDLAYYEALVNHLGPAARFLLLAEVFKGRQVKGLEIRVPALRTKMGALTCFTFSLRPDYLLKIGYVAHRAKGKAFDVDSYQRMLSKHRLRNIARYISEDGVFPTNIVVNVANRKHIRFDRGRQEGTGRKTGGEFGWLTLSPTYGAAWVIDGQHRLFAYSGHPKAQTSYLNVLAFAALSPSRQTQMFVDINSEQRRVKRSLLVELDATLKWDSEDDLTRVNAIISKVGMALDEVTGSTLKGRILLADAKRTSTRCVSLTSLFTALNKPGFFIISKKKWFTQYGPLWRDDPGHCMRRAARVLVAWLSTVATEAVEWWQLGAEEGGGLAMNDGVTVCINVLRSVLEHLNSTGTLPTTGDDDLVSRLCPYASALGAYFARMSPDERLRFRRFRGVEGQSNATRECQVALQESFPKYQPEGLAEWLARRDANTNDEARRIIDEMERAIQERVLSTLKEEFDADESAWWFEGVPMSVRKKVDDRINEAGGGKREASFDLLHYEAIIKQNWQMFKGMFAYDNANRSKDRGTEWLREIAGWRNKVMHSSRRDFLGVEELGRLQEYQEWLHEQLLATANDPSEVGS